jgi:HAE1 family hydrophobic/amphiphilic exporter-1
VLSMMGLMLGVGMLVDNAIVVLESIDRNHRLGAERKRAALQGTAQVALAVTASTATSLIVFLPLIVGGRSELTTWLREVGIAISLSLLASLFSSLTLIPLVSANLLRERPSPRVAAVSWLEERYARILGWTLRRKAMASGMVVAGLVVGILPFPLGLVKAGMFSASTNERLRLRYDFVDFAYKSDAERVVSRVEDYLFEHAAELGVAGVYSWFAENEAVSAITLAERGMPDDEVAELRKRIRAGLPEVPGVRITFDDDAEEGGSTTSFAVKFFGHDAGELQRLAEEAARRLETVEGVADVNSGAARARREIQVTIDREAALRQGLTAQDLSDVFAFTLGGMRLRRFDAGDREVETWLALRPVDRENLEDLKALQIGGREGREAVRLGDVASFQVVRREQQIVRENRRVRVAVRAAYEGESWDDAKQEIAGLMDAFELPPGYSWSWDDRVLEQEGQGQEMMVNLLLALALVYLVMASLFESLAQPFAILFSIPFALPGATWLLAATGTPFNMMAQIGLLILMGIVVNNGIVLLDHLNHLRREGMARDQAIVAAGRERLRPVLMTAATTILGLLPLAIGGSEVAGLFYYPLARTVMGGLLSSTVLTLVVLPLVNVGVENVAEWARGLWRRSAPVPARIVEAGPAPRRLVVGTPSS